MRLAGRARPSYLTPEPGGMAFTYPLVVLSDTGITGSYSLPTAEFVIRGNTGGECITRINIIRSYY